MVQAHVIRLVPPFRPKEVSTPHYHDVDFQMIYVLKGWYKTEFEGEGVHTFEAGSCWIQPPRAALKATRPVAAAKACSLVRFSSPRCSSPSSADRHRSSLTCIRATVHSHHLRCGNARQPVEHRFEPAGAGGDATPKPAPAPGTRRKLGSMTDTTGPWRNSSRPSKRTASPPTMGATTC
jgi:hypothetical protein